MNAKAPFDVISDHVTDACRRQNCTPRQLFQQAAERGHGGKPFSNADEVAAKWYNTWVMSGYNALVPMVKDFVLECNERHIERPIFNQLVFPFH